MPSNWLAAAAPVIAATATAAAYSCTTVINNRRLYRGLKHRADLERHLPNQLHSSSHAVRAAG
jgi:hypothetical protein